MTRCSVKSFGTGLIICTKSALKGTFNLIYAFGIPCLLVIVLMASQPGSPVIDKLRHAPIIVKALLLAWLVITAYGHYYYEFKLSASSSARKLKRGIIHFTALAITAYLGWSAPQIASTPLIGVLGDGTLGQYFWGAADAATNLALLPMRALLLFSLLGVTLLVIAGSLVMAVTLLWSMIETICKTGQQHMR